MRASIPRASTPRPSGRRAGETGSAYLIVLLSLVVLTVLGLSLATITGLEMEVGANERGTTRVFYSADSGIHVAVAQLLDSPNALNARQVQLFEGTQVNPSGAEVSRGAQLDISVLYVIRSDDCNYCPVNENEAKYKINRHAVTATATEMSWLGDDESPPADANVRSQKTIGVVFDLQPQGEPAIETLPTAGEAAKLKF